MATTIFNFGPVLDQVAAACVMLQQTENNNGTAIAAVGQAVEALAKSFADLITALGGGDQPSIDAVTAAVTNMNTTLNAVIARDQAP